MTPQGRQALRTIRRCADAGRCILLTHFQQRINQRGMTWPDVLALLDDPSSVRGDGRDDLDRPRWLVTGDTADGLRVELVCVVDEDEHGPLTLLVTAYWK